MNLFLYGLELSPVIARAVVDTDRFWRLATPAVLIDHDLSFVAPARPVIGGTPAAVDMPGRRVAGALVLATPHDIERLTRLYPVSRRPGKAAPFELVTASVLTHTSRLKSVDALVFRASEYADQRVAPSSETIEHLQAVALRLGHSDAWVDSLSHHLGEIVAA